VFVDFQHFTVRLQAYIQRKWNEGVISLATKLLQQATQSILWLALLPLTVALHLAGFRRLTVLTPRIGHLAIEVDTFLKRRALGEIPSRRYFITSPKATTSNAWLLRYWSAYLPIVTHPSLCFVLEALSRWKLLRYDLSDYVLRLNKTALAYSVATAWSNRPPLLALTDDDERWGQAQLTQLGVPDGAWFVAFHVREGGFSPADESVHRHRNTSVENMLPAVRIIVALGGYCIRMGDPTMTPLLREKGIVDYAHHPSRSSRLDVYLCAKTRFFLGNSSGLAFVASAFGVPSALANMTPFSNLGLLPCDLSIPKLLWSEELGRFLRFDEALSSEVSNYRYAALFDQAGISPVENSAEDIADLVLDMLRLLDRQEICILEDQLQQKVFAQLLKPGHYSHGTSAKIGASFLRNHTNLLSPLSK
jgi:putative glycosyltransferase (TIGR04372 family)